MTKKICIAFLLILLVVMLPIAFAAETTNLQAGAQSAKEAAKDVGQAAKETAKTVSKLQFETDTTKGQLEGETGEAIVVNVIGYDPSTIKSSLLEDDDIPVYVYLSGTTLGSLLGAGSKTEPLYGVPNIKLVNVRPVDVGTQKAVRGTPRYIRPKKYSLENLGFLAILLKRIEKEESIPDEINLSMVAEIFFEDADRTFSLFNQDLMVPEDADEGAWRQKDIEPYTFFAKRGALRVSSIQDNQVTVVLYSGSDLLPPYTGTPRPFTQLNLRVGETSTYQRIRESQGLMQNAFRVKLVEIVDPSKKRVKIRLDIDGTVYEKIVTEGARLYPGSEWIVKSITTEEDKTKAQVSVRVTLSSSKGTQTVQKTFFTTKSPTPSAQASTTTDPCASKTTSIEAMIVDTPTTTSLTATTTSVSMNINDAPFINLETGGKSKSNVTSIKKGFYINITKISDSGVEFNLYNVPSDTNTLPAAEGSYIMKETPVRLTPSGKEFSLLLKEKIPASGYAKFDIQVPASQVPQTKIDSASLNSAAQNAQTFVDKLKGIYQEHVLCTAVQEYKKVFTTYPGQVNDKGVPLEDIAAFKIAEAYDWLGYPQQAMEYYKKSLKSRQGDHVVKAEAKIGQLEKDIEQRASYVIARIQDVGREVEVKLVDVLGVRESEKPQARFDVQGTGTRTLTLGGELFKTPLTLKVQTKSYQYNWVVTKIDAKSVVVSRKFKDNPPYTFASSQTISLNKQVTLDGKVVSLKEVKTQKYALLNIIPGTGQPLRSVSNFTVHIPIEKRPTKLTPEKLLDKINKTEDTIKSLNDVIETFDKILTVWKKVCIFTFLYLTIKNSFLSGSARNVARGMVMRGKDGKGGWNQYCKINSGKNKPYSNFDECVSKNQEKIEKGLDESQKTIEQVNEEMKDYKNQAWYQEAMSKYNKFDKYGNLMGRDFYSKNTWRDYRYWQLMKESQSYQENTGQKVEKGTAYNFQKEVDNNLKSFDFEKSVKSYNQAVGILESGKYPGFDSKSADEKKQIFQDLLTQSALKKETVRSTQFLAISEMDVQVLSSVRQKGTKIVSYSPEGEINLKPATVEDYIRKLQSMKDKYPPNSDQRKWIDTQIQNMEKRFSKNLQTPLTSTHGAVYKGTADGKFYAFKGSLTVSDKLRKTYDPLAPVEYYADGRPYCVPTEKGNFVKILDFFTDGTAKTIQEWNVGSDGRLCTGDDILVKHHSVLARPENNAHYKRLLTLANKFGKKKKGETISAAGRKWTVSTNSAGLKKDATAPSCYDTMDPGDCKTLFGVCDPVICPPSRFNLNGNWKVDNVVQTGIIGSIFLGLHNFEMPYEPVPICLTGISAGLKSIKSILEGYVQCLKVAYVQGKTVGICDKIRSVYACEIIWREVLALFKMKGGLLKWISNKLSGSGNKEGGGEYLTFQSSFQNAQNSANFFFKQYSSTAFASFNARSTQEIGTTICRKAIYGKLPNFGEMLDQLATPEDPPQYTALMSVSPYSENQGLDQYQVYYHIYAGKTAHAPVTQTPGLFDQGGIVNKGTSANAGVDYSVFLKNDLGQVFYMTEKCKGIKGFIKRGGLADFTIDCVANKGFNQVCVSINGDIKCGFGKITTSFALNYVNDLIVASEAKRNIKSEQECAPSNPSASPSLLAAGVATKAGVTPPGVLGALSTGLDFSKTGIRRYCSIDNPGKGTNPNDFKIVGTCGKDAYGNNLGSCWIDMRSISIKDAERMENVKSTIDAQTLAKMKELAGVKDTLDKAQSEARLTELDNTPQTTCTELYTVLVGYRDLEKRTIDSKTGAQAQYKYAYTIDRLARDSKCSKEDPERAFRQLVSEFDNKLIDIRAKFFKEVTELQNKGVTGNALITQTQTLYVKADLDMRNLHAQYLNNLRTLAKKEKKEVLLAKYESELTKLLSTHRSGLTSKEVGGTQIKPVTQQQINELQAKCAKCKVGTIDICTESECHGLDGYCYYHKPSTSVAGVNLNPLGVIDPLVGECSTCAKATKCSDFNNDKKKCEDAECARLRNFNCKYKDEGKICYQVTTAQIKSVVDKEKECAVCHQQTTKLVKSLLSASPKCTRDDCSKRGTECYYYVSGTQPECHHCSHAKDCSYFKTKAECEKGCPEIGRQCEWTGLSCKKKEADCTANLNAYYNKFPGAKVLYAQGYYISEKPISSTSNNIVSYPVGTYSLRNLPLSVRRAFAAADKPTFVPSGSPTFHTGAITVTSYYTADCKDYANFAEFSAKVKLEGSGVCAGKCYRYDNGLKDDVDCSTYPNGVTASQVDAKGVIAVNYEKGTPGYIPYGSYVYLKFGKNSNLNGWYLAADTGGAFKGQPKIDVFSGVGKAASRQFLGTDGIKVTDVDVWVHPLMKGSLGLCSQTPSKTTSSATTTGAATTCIPLRDSTGNILNKVSYDRTDTSNFDNLYGKVVLVGSGNKAPLDYSKSTVDENIIKIDFLGKQIRINKKLEKVFKCVEQEIKQKCGENTYKLDSGSHAWRIENSVKTGISRHMYGVAFDYNPIENPYCHSERWSLCKSRTPTACCDPYNNVQCTGNDYCWKDNNEKRKMELCCNTDPSKRYKIPKCHIDAFRKFGFMWGGEWGPNGLGSDYSDRSDKWSGSADYMHFEFRSNPDKLPTNFGPSTSVTTPISAGVPTATGVASFYDKSKINSKGGLTEELKITDVYRPTRGSSFTMDLCTGRSNVGGDCMIEFSYNDDKLLKQSSRNAGYKSSRVWIPGGISGVKGQSLPLVVMLHGINSGGNLHKFLGNTGEGKALHILAGDLIKAGQVKPIMVAALSQDYNQKNSYLDSANRNLGSGEYLSTYLWRDFNMADFLTELKAHLPSDVSVDTSNIILIGHSGAGCSSYNGVFKVMNKYNNGGEPYRLKYVILSETCFKVGQNIVKDFLSKNSDAIVIGASSLDTEGDLHNLAPLNTAMSANLDVGSGEIPCPSGVFRKCKKNNNRYYGYITKRGVYVDTYGTISKLLTGHGTITGVFFQHFLLHYFKSSGIVTSSPVTTAVTAPFTDADIDFDNSIECNFDGKKVAMVGDSLTVHAQYMLWPDWIKKKCPGLAEVVEVGKGGYNTANILSSYNSAGVADNYDVVIIFAGVNDLTGIGGEYAASTVKTNLQTMYSAAKANGKYVVAMTISPWKGYSDGDHVWTQAKEDATDEVNRWIKNEAINVDKVIDTSEILADPNDRAALKSNYHWGDKLHLNPNTGQKALAWLVYKRVFEK